MEPLKERIAIKALHRKPQEVDRELLARVEALGASLRPTPVVRLVHSRLNLFAKLEYNNVVGSLKVDRADTGNEDSPRSLSSLSARRSRSVCFSSLFPVWKYLSAARRGPDAKAWLAAVLRETETVRGAPPDCSARQIGGEPQGAIEGWQGLQQMA
jgi:hypothetical protein